MMALLGPDGLPISEGGAVRRQMVDVHPGVGGKVVFTDTTLVDFPGGVRVRFSAGAFIILSEQDLDRMVARGILELPKV